MRISRLNMHRRKRKYKSTISRIFFIGLPIAALIAAFLMTGAYKLLSVDTMKNSGDNNQTAVNTFNQVLDLSGKKFYRAELGSFEDLASAEKYIKTLKSDKMNAFIVKEDGFKVVYGTFYALEIAKTISDELNKKNIKNRIAEISIQGVSLKYDSSDKDLVAFVKSCDELINKVFKEKSELSRAFALKAYEGYEAKLDSILASEEELAKRLDYLKEMQASESTSVLKEQYIKLLMDFKGSRVDSASVKKDYYKLQNSYMLQVKSYKDFIDRLSV